MPCNMCLSCISLDVYRPQIRYLSHKHLVVDHVLVLEFYTLYKNEEEETSEVVFLILFPVFITED